MLAKTKPTIRKKNFSDLDFMWFATFMYKDFITVVKWKEVSFLITV